VVLDGLNEPQRRAVTHHGGPLLVLAGAGTGKTRTLVAGGVAAGSQACGRPDPAADLHPRAASDMLARPRAGWDGSAGASERICGGTFHAIGVQDHPQHAESFSLPPQFTIVDPGDTVDILDVLRRTTGWRTPGSGRRGGGVRRYLHPW